MQAIPPQLTNAALAARYQCSPRTISRWRARGVDVQSVPAVVDHVIAHPGQGLNCIIAICRVFDEWRATQPTAAEETQAAWRNALLPTDYETPDSQ